jgi:hypothetical protein
MITAAIFILGLSIRSKSVLKIKRLLVPHMTLAGFIKMATFYNALLRMRRCATNEIRKSYDNEILFLNTFLLLKIFVSSMAKEI